MLYLIGKKYYSKNIGLYRDDGLALLKNVSGPASEIIQKHLQYLFKQKGLPANNYRVQLESRKLSWRHI